MFKTYNTLAEVPEADREHYAQGKDGKFYAQVSDDHPLMASKRKLKEEKETAEENERKAKADLSSANVIPRGHVPVPSAKAALLEQYEPLGTPEELKTMKGEHSGFKTKVQAQERREFLDKVRKAEGWGEGAVDVLLLISDLPDVDQQDTDEKDEHGAPKKKNVAKVKGADGAVTLRPFSEYFAEKHAALLPSVQAKKDEGTALASHGAGGGAQSNKPLADQLMAEWFPNPTEKASSAQAGK